MNYLHTVQVFISWSKDHSREIALALKNWLPSVLQSLKPFVSAKDIASGSRWQTDVTKKLSECDFGIVCVTSDNRSNEWLLFEAGALSKSIDNSRVVPLLVNMSMSELRTPLSMFMGETLDRSGVHNLLNSLNAATPEPLPEKTIISLMEKWWPDLETEVNAINQRYALPEEEEPDERSDRDLLEEIVLGLRVVQRSTDQIRRSTSRPHASSKMEFKRRVEDLAAGLRVTGTPRHTIIRFESLDEDQIRLIRRWAQRFDVNIEEFVEDGPDLFDVPSEDDANDES